MRPWRHTTSAIPWLYIPLGALIRRLDALAPCDGYFAELLGPQHHAVVNCR